MISANGNTFAGTKATGTRYIVRNNGIIQTSGDANYLPATRQGRCNGWAVRALIQRRQSEVVVDF